MPACRKLVQYGVMKGLLRRLHKYPIDLKHSPETSIARGKPVAKYFDGAHSYDDICAKTGKGLVFLKTTLALHLVWGHFSTSGLPLTTRHERCK